MTEELLALQAVDTTVDQLTHRRSHLPELADANVARAARAEWERRRDEIGRQLDALTAEIESAEHDSGDIDRHRDRLNAQLRTVIAPREAEALQHEIKTLSDRRSEVDDRGLNALEQQAELDDERASHVGREPSVAAALDAAETALTTAVGEIDQQLAEMVERRAALRTGVPPQLLSRYDDLRAQLGVAVARLVGSRCDGCHLDLSAAEVEAVKAVDRGELAECPQCGRLLVR
jgi:predicted  nucleic acid-binding Zn-ribbon protein